jgi:hypothetical protein
MCGQQAETTQHKVDKDKVAREKEQLQAQIIKLKNELDEKNNDAELALKKVERLEHDLHDSLSRDDGEVLICLSSLPKIIFLFLTEIESLELFFSKIGQKRAIIYHGIFLIVRHRIIIVQ